MWNDLRTSIRNYVLAELGESGKDLVTDYYVDRVPNNAEFPYLTSDLGTGVVPWTTIGHVSKGLTIEWGILGHCDDAHGGLAAIRELGSELLRIFSYASFDLDTYNVVSCVVKNQPKPYYDTPAQGVLVWNIYTNISLVLSEKGG